MARVEPAGPTADGAASPSARAPADTPVTAYVREHLRVAEAGSSGGGGNVAKARPHHRPLDFAKYARRHVALRLLYLGWLHDGLVCQATTANTVERHVLDAIARCRLAAEPTTAADCGLARCGRTDKGVSAYGQVLTCTVRSALTEWGEGDESMVPADDAQAFAERLSCASEYEYGRMLNAALPKSIRVLAWAPRPAGFDPRRSCTRRTYNYIFPRAGALDIDRMRSAGRLLVGERDYRNFCRIDKNEARLNMSYTRSIYEVAIEPVSADGAGASDWSLFELSVTGSGFLWHQIRCIAAVLIMVGRGLEDQSIVSELLDIGKVPARPQYDMASELPLCLFAAEFDRGTAPQRWHWSAESLCDIVRQLQATWAELATKAAMVRRMAHELAFSPQWLGGGGAPANRNYAQYQLDAVAGSGGRGGSGARGNRRHVPLLKRPRAESLESKREKAKMVKKWGKK